MVFLSKCTKSFEKNNKNFHINSVVLLHACSNSLKLLNKNTCRESACVISAKSVLSFRGQPPPNSRGCIQHDTYIGMYGKQADCEIQYNFVGVIRVIGCVTKTHGGELWDVLRRLHKDVIESMVYGMTRHIKIKNVSGEVYTLASWSIRAEEGGLVPVFEGHDGIKRQYIWAPQLDERGDYYARVVGAI